MKTMLSLFLLLTGLGTFAQSRVYTPETFLGVEVIVHHVTVKPGDSLQLPPNAYIRDLYMVEPGSYVVYNNEMSFVYPAVQGAGRISHRSEGSFTLGDQVITRSFEWEGSEKYPDNIIVSKDATFHLYYFTLAKIAKVSIDWTEVEQR